MKTRTLPLIVVCLIPWPAVAADWPQWRGPDRTDISKETGLLREYPSTGPKLLWTYSDAGVGYSGPAIVGDRLYTLGARGGKELVLALDVQTGKEIWSAPIGPVFTERRGDGPRGTPTVDGDVLFAIGGQGELVCVQTATGKNLWQVNLRRDLGGRVMSPWGYTESPLVDGDRIICTPGGSQGTLAALDKKTGRVIWRSKELTEASGYSSIIAAEVGGLRQYVQMTGKGVAGVAAHDGKLLWQHSNPDYRTAVIPTPIFHDSQVYVTSGYGAGCDLLKLTPAAKGTKAEKVYSNKNMVNQHGGVILLGEHLYGYSDGNRSWVCQNFRTGDIVWAERSKLGKGSVTCADGMLFCLSEDNGTLAVIEASPVGWKQLGRFKLPRETTKRQPQGKIWTHPVIANGRLYLRDQDLLFCFDIKAEPAR